jgi:hypothetical protein
MAPPVRPPQETVDFTGPPSSAPTIPFGEPAGDVKTAELSAVFGVIERSAFVDAIKPSTSVMNGDRARAKELSLLRPPEPVADSVPEAATRSSARSSGVRNVQRPPLPTLDLNHTAVCTHGVLRSHELARARVMVRVTGICAVIGTILLQLIEPVFDLTHGSAAVALLATVGIALWLEVKLLLHATLTRRQHLVLGFTTLAAILTVLAAAGPASPVALLAALLAHHYAGSGRRLETFGVPLLASVGIFGVGAATAADLLHPIGPFTTHATMTLAWTACLSAFVILAASLSHYRVTRIAQAAARARARVGRREALLDEAYANLGVLKTPMAGLRTGHQLGRFTAGAIIGRSHRAEIYAARAASDQPAEELRVAVKLYSPPLDRAETLAMYSRAVAASATSPTFVQILDYGALMCGSFFVASELLTGPDLGTQLREPQAMNNTEALILLDELAAALDRAHESELVHGNLKPENIVRDQRGRWRITDFGTPGARLVQSISAPRYRAPEARGVGTTPQEDVFSLAAIAYRLIIRCPAFCDHDPFETGDRRPIRPSALAPIPSDVDAIFALGLAADPNLRLTSTSEFTGGLRAALAGELPADLWARAHMVLALEPWSPSPL